MLALDEKNFESETKGLAIVDFWAEWCPPCRMLGPVFEAVSKEYAGKLKFAKVNVEEAPGLAQRFGVSGIPCMVVVKNGKEVDRIVGFLQKEALKQKIDAVLQKAK